MKADTHYEVLGLSPRAPAEEIERAYRHSLALYEEDALATYSLLGPDERRAFRARVHEAYETLRDPHRRQAYDASVGVAGPSAPLLPFPPPVARAEVRGSGAAGTERPPAPTPAPSRPAPVVLAEPVTGETLRRVREERGVSLRDIAAASKIGVRYLEYIEAERVSCLPAPVYLRGFVQEYARAVGLDPRRTADAYLARLAGPSR